MNHMITGDDGSSPASPYYREPMYANSCENCGCGTPHHKLTTIKFVPIDAPEEQEGEEISVCGECDFSMRRNPKIAVYR